MKKKGKIITTIASLCLAVALLAFGVYAAQTADFNITSSVTYTCNEVFVDVKVEYFLVAASDTALSSASSTFEGVTYTGTNPSMVALDDVMQKNDTTAAFAPTAHSAILTSTDKCAAIKITLTNKNPNTDAKVKISAIPGSVTNTEFTLTVGGDNYPTANTYKTIAKNNGTCVIEYRRWLLNTTADVSGASSWTPTVTIEKGTAPAS